MAISAPVETPLEVYLHTSYSPDCEWVEGELRERNVGQFDHSNLQGEIFTIFKAGYKARGHKTLIEQRLQVSPRRRYRVPDVLVIRREDKEQIITKPPLLIVEVLSPDDTITDYDDKITEYLSMGVKCIWVFDPAKQKVWAIGVDGTWMLHTDAVLQCDSLAINVQELFRAASE